MRAVAVLAGGMLGALSRWLVGLALAPVGGFPWATLVANVSGAFALGLVGVLSLDRTRSPLLRPLVAVGFLGAWTTFSTMAMEGVRLVEDGRWPLALGYWTVTLLGGLAAGAAGMWLGRRRPWRVADGRTVPAPVAVRVRRPRVDR